MDANLGEDALQIEAAADFLLLEDLPLLPRFAKDFKHRKMSAAVDDLVDFFQSSLSSRVVADLSNLYSRATTQFSDPQQIAKVRFPLQEGFFTDFCSLCMLWEIILSQQYCRTKEKSVYGTGPDMKSCALCAALKIRWRGATKRPRAQSFPLLTDWKDHC